MAVAKLNILKRKDAWYLRRRVPLAFASVEQRKEIWISLHTDSESLARQKAPLVWQQQIEVWQARLRGDFGDTEQQLAAAQDLARLNEIKFLSTQRVAELPLDQLLERVAPLIKAQTSPPPAPVEVFAALGPPDPPSITLSKALEVFWDLAQDRTLRKTEDQIRRWENPRKKAIKNLIGVVGDKAIDELSADDMLEFREWWIGRIRAEGVGPGSANKDFTHIGDVLKTVNRMKKLNISLPLSNLTLKEGAKVVRLPFSSDWIKTKLAAGGALDGMNAEARAIVEIMINSGMRPSEIAGLHESEICLAAPVPHIDLKGVGRELKTGSSPRKIPLLGVALSAMKRYPKGFPRYAENSASLSGAVNKFLRENGLLETKDHTLYSLRHSFEDRMLASGVDERIRRDLMGHSLGGRERYGEGGKLDHVARLLEPISF